MLATGREALETAFVEIILGLIALAFVVALIATPFIAFSLLGRVVRLEDQLRELRQKVDRWHSDEHRKTFETPPIVAAKPEFVAAPQPAAEEHPTVVEQPPPLPEAPLPGERAKHFAELQAVKNQRLAEEVVDDDEGQEPLPLSAAKPELISPAVVEWIAERWMAWIGAVALLFGVGFFLKYAMDRGWLGPEVRVAMGLGFAAVQYVLAIVLLKRDYRPVGQGVAGSALGFWYLSLYAAHHWYSLVSETTMFAGMALGAAAALALAIVENAQPIAILGLLGGFLAPYLMSTRTPSPWPLFGYILALDATVLAGASFRKWRATELLAFVVTALLWVAWIGGVYTPVYLVDVLTLLTVFFALFVAVGVWNSLVRDRSIEPGDLIIVFATPLAYAVALYDVTKERYSDYHGAGAVALAAVYALLTAVGRTLRPSQKVLNDCLLGISLSFLAAAVPLQFTGHWIPIVWTAYAAVLVTVGLRRDVPLLRAGGFSLLALVQVLLATYVVETVADPQRFTPRWLTRPGWLDAPLSANWWSFINGRSLAMLSNAIALGWIAREYRRHQGSVKDWEIGAAGRMLFASALAATGTAILETYALIARRNWPLEGFYGMTGIYLALLFGALAALALRPGPRWLFEAARVTAFLLFVFLCVGTMDFAAHPSRPAALAPHPMWSMPILLNPRGFAYLTTALAAGFVFLLIRRRPEFTSNSPQAKTWTPASQFAFLGLLSMWLTVATETFAMSHWRHWNGTEALVAHVIHVAVLTAASSYLTIRIGPPNSVGIPVVAGILTAFLCLALGARTFDQSIWSKEATGPWWLLPAVVNPRGLAFAVAVGALTLFARLHRHRDKLREDDILGDVTAYGIASLLAHLTLWHAITVEVYALGAHQDWGSGKILAVSLAWTVYGLVLFAVGVARRWTSVRLASLAVFVATTAKVFLYDVWELSPVIRYFAFIGLGVALLSTSYFYRRFRDRVRQFIANE